MSTAGLTSHFICLPNLKTTLEFSGQPLPINSICQMKTICHPICEVKWKEILRDSLSILPPPEKKKDTSMGCPG